MDPAGAEVFVGVRSFGWAVGDIALGKHMSAQDPLGPIFMSTIYWSGMLHPCGHIAIIVFDRYQPARLVPDAFQFSLTTSSRHSFTGVSSPGAGPSGATANAVPFVAPTTPRALDVAALHAELARLQTKLLNLEATQQAQAAQLAAAERDIIILDDRVTETQDDMAQMEIDLTKEVDTSVRNALGRTERMFRETKDLIKILMSMLP